jgi:DNA invertase Pin-like site-specific DNA recombinase
VLCFSAPIHPLRASVAEPHQRITSSRLGAWDPGVDSVVNHPQVDRPVLGASHLQRPKGWRNAAEKLAQAYRRLLEATGRVVGQAKRFATEIGDGVKRAADTRRQVVLEGLRRELESMVPRVRQVMRQTNARVSTAAQDETGQVRQLKAAGCEKVFREKITGTTADRPQLAKLIKALAPGDVVITPAVDRLSRDTTDLLVIARDMQRAGAGIRSLAEPFLDTTSDFAEIIFAILGVAAKLERRRILERTARGRADARPGRRQGNGVKFGRKPILTPHQQNEARKRLEAGETQRSVARSYNVSQSTISRLTI